MHQTDRSGREVSIRADILIAAGQGPEWGHEDPIAGQKLRVCYGVVAAMRLPDRALEAFPDVNK